MSKKCPKCGNVNCTIPKMEHHGEQWLSCLICGQTSRESRFNDVTIFDRITASPEVLAPEFVYCEKTLTDGDIWYSLLLGEIGYSTESDAIAATVARLKEIEK